MATAEIKIKSSFNPNGFDQARNATTKLDKQIKEAAHNINAGFQNIQTGNVVSGIGQITNGIKNFVSSNPAILALAGSFTLLAKGISECVKEFSQAQVIQVRFEQSLRSMGLGVFINQFDNFASSLQRTTGISDEVIKDVVQIGIQMGISVGDIERTVKVATDLSVTFGIDLRSAVEMLAKAQEGEITQLGRLLPNMKDTIKNAKDYSEILGVVESRVNGAAEAQGNTLVGSMNKLKQTFSDLKETIGSAFIPQLQSIYEWLAKIIEKMNYNAKMSLGVAGYEIDKQINDLKAQKMGLQMTTSPTTDEEKQIIQKQIEAIDNQIAILKQQKVANETQQKILQEMEKKQQEASKSTTTTATSIPTTPTTPPTTSNPFIYGGQTYLQMEHTLLKLEELMSDLIEEEEEQVSTIQETTTNILVLSQSISQVSGQFRTTERDLTSFGDRLRNSIRDFFGNTLGIDLSSVQGFILSIIQQMQTFQALKNVLQPIIKMLDSAFKPILQALAPILQVIYQILAPILQLIIPPLIVFAVMIANIVQALKALATTIYYIVTLKWNRLDEVKWTAFTGEQISQMIQDAQAGIANAATENPFSNVTSTSATSTTSYSASGARDIYVNIYFNNSYVNGDAREIALKLRDEIRLAEVLGY